MKSDDSPQGKCDLAAKVQYQVQQPPSPLGEFLLAYGLPLILLGGVWYFGYRRMAGGGAGGMGGIFGVGKSKATEVKPEEVGVTYQDVGGCDEAITELQEIIQFLKTPEQFARLGGRIPKGVLLVGPPGHFPPRRGRPTAGAVRLARVRSYPSNGAGSGGCQRER